MNGERAVAIVTGASQGLGLGTARALAHRGFDLVLVDRDELSSDASTLLQEVEDVGGRAIGIRHDITDLDHTEEVIREVVGKFGHIDCVMNNAGVAARPLTDVLELGPEQFDRVFDVNVRGTFFFAQAAARAMIESAAGTHHRSMFFVSSVLAELVSIDRAQYGMSKAAVSMLTKVLALRLASHGITVHEIRPGMMKTLMTAQVGGDLMSERIASGRVPLARWGTSDDVGQTVASVASGALPYATGQPLWVDGGLAIPRSTLS